MNMNACTGFTTQETGDMGSGPNDNWCRLAQYVFYTFISLLIYITFIASSTMVYNAGNEGDGLWTEQQLVLFGLCYVFFFHIYLGTNLYYFCSIIHNERKHEHRVCRKQGRWVVGQMTLVVVWPVVCVCVRVFHMY